MHPLAPPPKSKRTRFEWSRLLTSKVFLIILSLYLIVFAELLAMTVYAQTAVKYNPEIPTLYIPKKSKVTPLQEAPPPAPKNTDTTTYPYKLSIPKLGVNAGVLALGTNPKGEMAAPTTLYQTSWYNKGARPGQTGSTVIAGHYGAPNQVGVFRNLPQLKSGDKVTITTAEQPYTYVVYKVATINQGNADLQEIFNKRDGTYLNLITCFGAWNAATFSYNQRTVVYTKLIQ